MQDIGPGSPTRRQRGQTVEALSPRKPEIREASSLRFGGLQNGFAAPPQLRANPRARQPTGSPKHEVADAVPSPGSPHSLEGSVEEVAHEWDEQSQVRHRSYRH